MKEGIIIVLNGLESYLKWGIEKDYHTILENNDNPNVRISFTTQFSKAQISIREEIKKELEKVKNKYTEVKSITKIGLISEYNKEKSQKIKDRMMIKSNKP